MQRKSQSQKQIFGTQPKLKEQDYDKYMREVKQYCKKMNNRIDHALNDQNKSIKRKKIQLEKQLQQLRQKYTHQRMRIKQMQDYFNKNCSSVIKNDIQKWQQNQSYFRNLLQTYSTQIQIQNLINQKNKQKIKLLKQQLKQTLKQDIKSQVKQRLQQKSLSKFNQSNRQFGNSKLSKSKSSQLKKSRSTKSQSKLTTKIRTQTSQYFGPNQIYLENNLTNRYQQLIINNKKIQTESQQNNLPLITDKSIRLKTDMSLPSLKKTNYLQLQKIKNNQFNFMKPIKTIKKKNQEQSSLPQIIQLFNFYFNKVTNKEIEIDWFQKVVFNERNLNKIISHLQNQFDQVTGKNNKNPSNNKVKDIVAKNLFRLKTQSSIIKSKSKIQIKDKSIISLHQNNQSISQRLIN